MTDLSELTVPKTKQVHLEYPNIGKLFADDKKEQPMIIEVFGPSSDAAIRLKKQAIRDVERQISKKGKTDVGNLEEKDIERLVALTSDVRNINLGGKPITKANIETVYRNPDYFWIVEQVRNGIDEWESFLLA